MGWEVGGSFQREGTYVYLRLIQVDVQQKSTQYCKAIILQLKIIFLLTKEEVRPGETAVTLLKHNFSNMQV